MRRVAARIAVLSLTGAALAGCESSADRVPFEGDDRSRTGTIAGTPEALMVRFREVRGFGSSRASWELEVLQLAGDVRVRGSIRTGGSSIPILHEMEPEEFLEFWEWLKPFPVDRVQLEADETRPEEGWRKSLDVDVVLDDETRLVSRNTWTRPLLGAEWVADVENRLHAMALDLADSEMDRLESEPAPEPAEDDRAEDDWPPPERLLDALDEADPNPSEESP